MSWPRKDSSCVNLAFTSEEVLEQDDVSSSSSRILRVTLLADEWGSSKGGLSTINRELAKQLAEHLNVEVTFLVPQGSDVNKTAGYDFDITIVEAQERPGYEPVDWLAFPPSDLSIDVVVGHGVKLGRQAQIIRESHHCKWVQVVHIAPEELAMYKCYSGAIPKGTDKHQVEIQLCKIADFVVAVGPKLTENFSAYLRSCKKEVFDLTPSIFNDFSHIEQAPHDRLKFRVLVFGRGDPEDFELKGYDIASQAVAHLKDSNFYLIFVGARSGKEDEVKENLLKHGISRSQLTVRSFCENREKLATLFCEADLAIMPSRTEGFGLTALEALSAGLPVLVCGNSGFGEALRKVPFGSSCIVDSEDAKVWAEEIKRVQQKDRESRLDESEVLRTGYAKKFNWQKQCEAFVEKLLSLVHAAQSSECVEFQARTVSLPYYGFQSGEHLQSLAGTASHLQNDAQSSECVESQARMGCLPYYELRKLISYIKDVYIRRARLQPVPWCDTSVLSLQRVYTRLTIKARKMQDPVLTSQEVEMYDIFSSHDDCENPRSVLVEGDPGIGKTTFCLKMANDWATGAIPVNCSFPDVELVLLLKCGDVDGNVQKTIEDQLFPKDVTDQEKKSCLEHIQRIQEKLLLILDGLDELPEHARQDVKDVLLKKIFPRCLLVVTARQERGIHVRREFDTRLEITGFIRRDAFHYINRHFQDKGKECLADALIKEIENQEKKNLLYKYKYLAEFGYYKDEYLSELLMNPLNTVLLCLVFEDCKGKLPSTRTELYRSIVFCLLKRFCTKKGIPIDGSTLFEQFEDVLIGLGKLALDGLKKDCMYFSEKKLIPSTRQVTEMGFVSKEASTKVIEPEHSYSFPHKTFQEFFAAFYLAHLVRTDTVDVYEFVSSIRDLEDRFRHVFLFVAGVLGKDGRHHFELLGQLVKEKRSGFKHPCEFLFDSFKESGHIEEMAAATARSMSISDLAIEGEVTLHVIGNSAVQDECECEGHEDLRDRRNLLVTFGDFVLPSGVDKFLSESTSLHSLTLCTYPCCVHDAVLASLVLSENTSLTSLTLDMLKCDLNDATLDSLGKGLSENRSLTSLALNMSGCHLDDAALAFLCKGLSGNTSLTSLTLNMSTCDLNDAILASLGKGLSENKSLTSLTLNMSWCNLSDATLASLGKGLSDSKSLASLTLNLSDCHLNGVTLTSLGNALSERTSLTSLSLNMSGCVLSDEPTLAFFGKGLFENTSLTVLTLDMSHCSLKDATLTLLAKGLSENKSLTSLTLNMSWCALNDATLTLLAKGLSEMTSLTSLTLNKSVLDPKDATLSSITECLSRKSLWFDWPVV